MRTFRHLVVSFFLASAGWAQAQDSNANANVVFAQAIQMYTRSQSLDDAGQKQAAIEVLRLFDLILTAYPDSIPGQRIKSEAQIGPIDLAALRKLAGVPDTEEIAETTAPETEAAEIDAPEVLEWYQRVLYSGSPEGGFSHGEYPSVGQRTHPGIDLIAACGEEITAPVNATVAKVIKVGDPLFPQTGNAIILRYRSTFLAYFFLGSAPLVSEGDVVKGQAIGSTGPLHDPNTCGVHFEVRRFGENGNPILPLWNDVLAVGNWSNDPAFKTAWRNPEAWLLWLGRQNNTDPMLLVQKDDIFIYYSRFLGRFNEQTRLFYRISRSEQGLRLDRSVVVSRVLKRNLRLELNSLSGWVNSDATENVIQPGDRLSFRFMATLLNQDNPDEVILSRNISVDARLVKGVFSPLSRSSILTFPEVSLKLADTIRLELVASDGKVFPLGPDIMLETIEPEENDLPDLVAAAEGILTAFEDCPNRADSIEDATITFSFFTLREAPDKIYNLRWIDYSGMSRLQARIEYQRIRRGLAACGVLEIVSQSSENRPSIPFEIVLGGSTQ